jgi:hypothetical protein
MSVFIVASKSLDTLAGIVNDPNPFTVKAAIQTLTSMYPMIFRMLYESFMPSLAHCYSLYSHLGVLTAICGPHGIRWFYVKLGFSISFGPQALALA